MTSLFGTTTEEKIATIYELASNRCFEQAYCLSEEILSTDHSNLDARIALATALSFDGHFAQALEHLHYVLCADPYYIDALILKGTIMRWERNYPSSICCFEKVLNLNEQNFTALEGLAYTNATRGDFGRAKSLIRCFTPQTPEDKCDWLSLNNYIFDGPTLNLFYYHYQDSQDLRTNKFYTSLAKWAGDWGGDVTYRHAFCSEPMIDGSKAHETLNSVDFSLRRLLNDYLDLTGGIGYAWISEDSHGNFVTGNIAATLSTNWGLFDFGSIYDVYDETAAGLFFKIRTWTTYIDYIKIFGRTSLGGSYFYTKYSDANHSNEVDLFIQNLVFDSLFQVLINYNISYLNFESQPFSTVFNNPIFGDHGYFDPKNGLNNQISFPIIFDNQQELYFNILPIIGYTTYKFRDFFLNNIHMNGPFYIISGLLGYRLTNKIFAEISGERGAYHLTGLIYKYSVVTGRVQWIF